ncbi:hypothetical protein L484_019096 [Morus notabilis]|uniref:Transmembrane protein 45B n=1 Tax=Morus notabilis TaxID=981085 RepID=W9SBF5_9ROSA|nr:transmembrane protein 45B [Morus notabilis]EXC34499.1 hypothetical protein L484_019096 [Morus notabilis]
MGSFIGHVLPGIGFLLLGLWHLFNHIKLHTLHPTSYTSPIWFPTSKLRHLELVLIIAGCFVFIVIELFVGPKKHHPFDSDGTIPNNHLHNVEHAVIALTIFTYALLSLIIDRAALPAAHGVKKARHSLSLFLAAVAFAQELLLFRLTSTDHMGAEGQYHMLLQLIIFVSLITTLLGFGFPNSFMVSFVRSLSIFFQGVWFILVGFMLWTPALITKGCWMNHEEGHYVVRCDGEASLHRAKSIANLLFSFFVIGIAVFGACFYLRMVRIYGENVDYFSLDLKSDKREDKNTDDVEFQKTNELSESYKSFIDGHVHVRRFELAPR